MNQPVTVAAELVYDSIPADAEPKHRTAMAMPLVDPAAWRELIAEINGPRPAEHDEFHRRLGVYDDRFQVAAPGGELAILHLSAPDLRAAVGAFCGVRGAARRVAQAAEPGRHRPRLEPSAARSAAGAGVQLAGRLWIARSGRSGAGVGTEAS